MSLSFTGAGAFATAPRGGYDEYALAKAAEMLVKHPGAYQATQRATGVPMDLLRIMHPSSARPPVRIFPVSRVVSADDWKRSQLAKVTIGRRVTVNEIQGVVSDHFKLPPNAMTCESRGRAIARPRQIAMYLCKQHTNRSYPDIGRRFGDRDHTTVLHAVNKIESLIETDPEMVRHINDLSMKLSIGARRLDDMIERTEKRLASLKAMRARSTMGMAA